MNRFSYWWTKTAPAGSRMCCALGQKTGAPGIQNSRRATMLLENHISGLSGFPLSGKNSRCASSALSGQPGLGARLILGIRFDAGEITLSGTAEDIPLYDQKIALVRHQNGDWGGVTEQEWAENNRSLQNGRGVVHFPVSFRERRLFRLETDLADSKTTIRWERESV